MTMHPEVLRATILAAIEAAPDWTKRQLMSEKRAQRERAEEVLAAKIVAALSRTS